jgi:hypothetical protein
MRTCTKCKVEKPLTDYYKHKKGKDGFSYDCKSCIKQQSKDHHKKYQQTHKGKESHKKSCFQWNTKKQGVYGWFDEDIALYIGQSKRLLSRISTHKSWLKNPNIKHNHPELYGALRQHKNASIRIIEECPPEVLLEREQYYINKLKPKYNTYE